MPKIDRTHDVTKQSWEKSANGHSDFPLQNLPLCVFSRNGGAPRSGVAIGDMILDLVALSEFGFLRGTPGHVVAQAARAPLNDFLAEGPEIRQRLREILFDFLVDGAMPRLGLLVPQSDVTLHLPLAVADFTDFFAGINHALNVGRMLRPDQPLMPNYKYLPVAYQGRASTVRPSGARLLRPHGQRKPGKETVPSFGPSRNLDFELELGIWLGTGSQIGQRVKVGEAAEHIAGYCLLNDWSARDIQGWEATPLGPFLGKSFLTTVSPYLITPEALAPFMVAQPARAEGDPAPLDYLLDARDQTEGAVSITLEAQLLTPTMVEAKMEPHVLSRTSSLAMYWTAAQLIAHQASNGCELSTGDLLGTGTLSGPVPESAGSLLELSRGGREPVALSSGETRRFLEDGDTVLLRAWAEREGFARIGFGPCVGTVEPG